MKILVKKTTGEIIEFLFRPDESILELSRRLEELGVTLNLEGMDLIENGKIFDFLVPKHLMPAESVKCAVPWCGSSKIDDPNKVFFHFPNEKIRCHQWVLYCQRFETDPGKKRLTLTNYSTICSDHFRADQFVKNTNTLLKRTAVPCVSECEWTNSLRKTADTGLLNTFHHQVSKTKSNLGSCSSNRLCRLCANVSTDFFFIFDEFGRNMKLSEKINLCFPFEVNPCDPLPKQICRNCLEQLEELFSMADLCSITQHKLMDIFSSDHTATEILPSYSLDNLIGKCPLCDVGDISLVNQITENIFKTEEDAMLLSSQFISFEDMTEPSFNNHGIKIEPPGSGLSSSSLGDELFIENNPDNEIGLPSKSSNNYWETSHSSDAHSTSMFGIGASTSGKFGLECGAYGDKTKEDASSEVMWFSCRICASEYKERDELLKHSFEHSSKAFYQCAACVAFFTNESEFENHNLLHEQEVYFCNVCQKQFTSVLAISTHLCKPSKCPVCSKILSNGYTFSNHMKSHQSSSYCGICCKLFTDEVKLQKHSLYVHNSKRSHCCEECGKVFKSEASMKYHQRIHENNEKSKPYTCEWCGRNFVRRSMLLSHLTSSHQHCSARVECFTCKICSEAFPNSRTALSHLANKHQAENFSDSSFCFDMSQIRKVFVCEFCQRCYSSECALNLHREQHPLECPYECKHCSSHFLTLDNFNTHLKVHSEGNTTIAYSTDFVIAKSYLCEFCERCFINYTKYKEHLSIHFGPEPYECRHHCSLKFSTLSEAVQHRLQYSLSSSSLEVYDTLRPYQCHFCNKGFSIEDALIKHIRMHTGEKPFMCDLCGKGFSQSSGLYTHQKVHSSARPYSCSLCPRTFKIKGDRDVHVRKHSGERPYSCEFCGKAFMTQHVYSQHRKIHTGERPYRCDVCGIAFRRSHVLTVHKRIHTGEKPNVCIYCGKRYRQKGDMLKHCRLQHGIGTSKQPQIIYK